MGSVMKQQRRGASHKQDNKKATGSEKDAARRKNIIPWWLFWDGVRNISGGLCQI